MPQDEQTAGYSDALQNSEAYAGTSLGASDSCRRALTVMAGALLAVTMLAVTVCCDCRVRDGRKQEA